MIPKTIIHLLSGGLDSTTLLYDLHSKGENIYCLLFDYGQPHVQELTFAKHHCRRLNVLFTTLQIPKLGGLNEKSWIVPNRNAIMLSIAVNMAVKANADTVTIGCNKNDSEMFPDCSESFISSMNSAVNNAGYSIEICAPYIRKAKWEILGLSREIGVDVNMTWTCYRGGSEPCGKCPACKYLELAQKNI